MIRDRVEEFLDINVTVRPLTPEQTTELKCLLDDASNDELVGISRRFPVQFEDWMQEWKGGQRPIPGTGGLSVGDWVWHRGLDRKGIIVDSSHVGLTVNWFEPPSEASPTPREVAVKDVSRAHGEPDYACSECGADITPYDGGEPGRHDSTCSRYMVVPDLDEIRASLHEMQHDLEEDV